MTLLKSQKIILLQPSSFVIFNGELRKVTSAPTIIYKDIPIINITHLPLLPSNSKEGQIKNNHHRNHPKEGEKHHHQIEGEYDSTK